MKTNKATIGGVLMSPNVKVSIIIFYLSIAFIVLFLFYMFFGQEYVYAKKYAAKLLGYGLPEKTEVLEQDFDYGVLYGGGPSGSGGYPTVVSYQRLQTELSEKDNQHYHRQDF